MNRKLRGNLGGTDAVDGKQDIALADKLALLDIDFGDTRIEWQGNRGIT